MRMLSFAFLVIFSLVSIGCAVTLQPSQQGEWSGSHFHNAKYKVTKDVREVKKSPDEEAPSK